MNKLSGLDWVAFILLLIGGLNWGLVGLLKWDLVASVLGNMSTMSRLVYDLVGLSALYFLLTSGKLSRR